MDIKEKISKVMKQAVDHCEVMGVNLLVEKGGEELLYCEEGMADRENRRLISRDTIFRLYSQTKPVTAACAMVKRSVYEEVGGLEEKLTVAFNDVDLGLKIVTAGYLIVFDPYAELYHYESKSRGVNDEKKERHAREVRYTQEKWADFLAAGDPCYNQNLTLAKHNFSLRK